MTKKDSEALELCITIVDATPSMRSILKNCAGENRIRVAVGLSRPDPGKIRQF